jgi:hypothetical protein
MPFETWENIPKSQEDNETIEQAIARLITAHNASEESHLGLGQSLQSHKASEIIDHAALSIISDKVKSYSIFPDHLASDRIVIRPTLETLDGWNQEGLGSCSLDLGVVVLFSGSSINNYRRIYGSADYYDLSVGSGNPVFETILKFDKVVSQEGYFGIGSIDTNFLGFKVVNSVLYACTVSDGSEYLELLSGVDITDRNAFRIVSDSAVSTKFYVNNELLYTEETYFPLTDESLTSLYFSIKTTEASQKRMIIFEARMIIDS